MRPYFHFQILLEKEHPEYQFSCFNQRLVCLRERSDRNVQRIIELQLDLGLRNNLIKAQLSGSYRMQKQFGFMELFHDYIDFS
jgi:hypothetical protein